MSCPTTLKYSKCPPRMDDGRHFTDYRSSCYSNALFGYEKQIECSHDYRTFLTQNALKIMKSNTESAWKKNGIGPCKNLCLGINEMRPGNSTPDNFENCIPPQDYMRYNGALPTKTPVLHTRKSVPSGMPLEPSKSSKYSKFTVPFFS